MNPLSSYSAISAYHLAETCKAMWLSDPATVIQNVFRSNGYDLGHFEFHPKSGLKPAWYDALVGNQVVVAIGGISSQAQGAAIFASLSYPFSGPGTWEANSLAYLHAKEISDYVGVKWFKRADSYCLSGHSYGGTLAEVLAGIVLDQVQPVTVDVITFGSPRPGPTSLAERLGRAAVRRWQNDGDPVPRFPPHQDEAPAGTIALGFPTAFMISQYVQPAGGVVLTSDGNYSAGHLPPLFQPIADVNLIQWAAGVEGIQSRDHTIIEYVKRLSMTAALAGNGPAINNAPSGAEQPLLLTESVFGSLATVVADRLLALANEGVKMAYIPPNYRPSIINAGIGGWHVMWMGTTICASDSKSKANSVRKYLFKWLRTMLDEPIVSVSGMSTAFNAYWTAASTPGLGFIPNQQID